MAPSKRSSHRKPKELRRQAERLLAEAAERTEQNLKAGLKTVTISKKELLDNLRGKSAHSPFLTQIGWGNAVRGQSFVLRFTLVNPDPFPWEDGNLGLLVFWAPGASVMGVGEALAAADPAIGLVSIEIGVLNPSAGTYDLRADHLIPAGARAGRNDLNYLLYTVDPFADGAILKRGTLGIVVG